MPRTTAAAGRALESKMFARYKFNARPSMYFPELLTVKTNKDLIFVLDDLFPQKVLDSMWNYDYDQIPWEARSLESTAGGTERYDFYPWQPLKPIFLTTTKQYILKGLKDRMNSAAEIEGIGVEFVLRSRPSDGGQKIHFDCQELGSIWSMLIHISGADGRTMFADSMKSNEVVAEVDFKPGRVVMFPSIYAHYGERPSAGTRYVLNSVVKMKNFEPVSRVFDRCPELQRYLDKMK